MKTLLLFFSAAALFGRYHVLTTIAKIRDHRLDAMSLELMGRESI
jgi:hypothetical protein